MSKKWKVSLAALTVLATTLAACSSPKEPANSSSPSPSTEATSSPSGSDEPKDYGKVYVYNNYSLGNAVNLSKKEDLDAVRAYIKEKSGVEVMEVIPPKGSEEDRLNLLLAGNEPLDIFFGKMDLHQANGAALGLNKLIEEFGPNIKKVWPETWSQASYQALSTKDGELWGLPVSPPMSGNAITMRKDWLDKLDLKVPTNLEEYEEVLKAFKEKDPVGNGETIPMITSFNEMNKIMSGLFMDNAYGTWIDDEGKVRPSVQNPGYLEFVTLMADWYQKGYIYRESFASDATKVIDLVRANRVASAVTWHSRTMAQTMTLRDTLAPDAEYVVADLQGPKGYGRQVDGVAKTGTMVSKKSQNPEGAVRYLDWLLSDVENYLTGMLGINGKHWEWVDKEKGTYKQLNQDYVGEFMGGFSFAMTVQFSADDPMSNDQWIRPFFANYLTTTENVKYEAIWDVSHLIETLSYRRCRANVDRHRAYD